MVGEVFDELDNDYKRIITTKIEGTSSSNESSPEFFYKTSSFSTKEGKNYQDFSQLL
jgi:hypothetical protein